MRRPLVPLTVCYMVGIISGPYSFYVFLVATLFCIFALVVAYVKKQPQHGILLSYLFFVAGVLAIGNARSLPPDHLTKLEMMFLRRSVEIEGLIDSDVELRTNKGTRSVFYLKVHKIKSIAVSGRLYVQLFRRTEASYGDRVVFTAKLAQPYDDGESGPSTFSDYLRRKGVYHIATVGKKARFDVIQRDCHSPVGRIYRWRHVLLRRISDHFSTAEAGFLKAILLGDRSGIPDHVEQLFLRTGTVHIIAISGLHIVLVAGIVLSMLRICRLPRKTQFSLAVVILAVYAILAGGRDSVYRAVLMCAIFLEGKLIERESDTLNSLAAAALIILLFWPLNLFEIGFQLSFLCVLAIIVCVPRIQRLFSHTGGGTGWLRKYMSDSFSVSLGVWLGVWPLVAYYFQMITPVSIAANLVIVPLSLLIVMLGMGFLLSSMFPPAVYLTGCFVIGLKVSLAMIVFACSCFEKIPGGYYFVESIKLWHVIVYYSFGAAVLSIIISYKFSSGAEKIR